MASQGMYQTSKGYTCPRAWLPRACIKHQREIQGPSYCSVFTVSTGAFDLPTQSEINYYYYYYYYIPHHEQVYTQEYDYMKLKRRGNTYNTVQTTAIKTRNIQRPISDFTDQPSYGLICTRIVTHT